MQQVQSAPLRQGSYTRTNGAPPPQHDVWPRFHIEAVEDPIASQRAGRPIFRDEERVEINMPGNPYSKPVMVVTDEHRERWPVEYEKFKKSGEVAVNGTPLEMWPILKPSMVKELKALDILTIEQVAHLNDHAIQRIPMLGRRLKELAIVYLDDAERTAFATEAQAREDQKDARIADLELRLENMSAQLTQVYSLLQAKNDAPNPLATLIPGMADPEELRKFLSPQAPRPPVQSALEELPLPVPRRRKNAAQPQESGND